MFKAFFLWVERAAGVAAEWGLLIGLLAAAVLMQWIAFAVQLGCIALQLCKFGYLCRWFGLMCQ